MPAELPRPSWYGNRRDFLIDAARKAGVIYASSSFATLLAACGGKDKIEDFEIPSRTFSSELFPWIKEQEGKETTYFLVETIRPRQVFFAILEDQDLKVFTFDGRGNAVKVFDDEACLLQDNQVVARWLPATIPKELCSALFLFRAQLIDRLGSERSRIGDLLVSTIKDGSLLSDEGLLWLLSRGRWYQTDAPTSRLILAPKSPPILEPFVRQIPESENKLIFKNGELLVEPNGPLWYLQNNGRYKVGEKLQDFAQKRYKNMRAWEVPRWVVDKIPEKRFPATFNDQYGREIDARSPRLIALMAGLGSSADETPKTFAKIIQGLKLLGWRDNQIVFVSHKVDRDTNGGLIPRKYTKEDAQSPIKSREACGLYLDWLSLNAPLSQVVGCGHSMGGDGIFHATVLHPGAFCQVNTINAPLTGTDKNLSVSFEDLLAFGCDDKWVLANQCEAIRSYMSAGENPEYAQNIENWAERIRRNGVDLFNFSAVRDPIVSTSHAVLKNSNNRVGDYQVRLSWDWAHDYKWDPRVKLTESVHGLLLSYEPFIAELLRVIGRP